MANINDRIEKENPEQFIEVDREETIAEKRIAKARKGLAGYFITHFRVALLLILSILLLGSMAVMNIDRESDPEVKIPIAVVSTFYPGASPSDIESLVTDEIENRLEELDDVKIVTSNSQTSISSIVIEFEASADLDDSIRELKDKVAEVNGLPDEAEDPVVTQIRANDFPIITFSLVGNLTDTQLKQLGEIVQDELESISGVSEAPLLGAKETEYSVVVDKESLSRLSLPMSQVVGAIAASNMDMPLGDITINDLNYNLRTVSKFKSIEDLKKVVVSNDDGAPVLLEDVAQVQEKFKDVETISKFSVGGEKAVSSISLQLFKKTGGNILNIVDSAKERVEELQAKQIIPKEVKIEISSDYSAFIREDLNTLGNSGLQATVLIFIVMLLALSFKEALISLFSIPMTFLITFAVLYNTGFTLNSMTLYALVLSLGLLVDTFIVILEGIFHNIREGYGPRRAALLSVSHYKKPLTAGTLTTISAFVPMLLVSGILGEYLKIFPITIAITLLASLFVSLVLVPSVGGVFLKAGKPKEQKDSLLEKYLTNALRRKYKKAVVKFLASRKAKVKTTVSMLIMLFASLGLLVGGIVPVELFPKIDIDFAFVDIEMPVGTDLEATEKVVDLVEAKLYEKDYIKSFVTTIGQSSSVGFSSGSSNEHLANININFVDEEDRDLKSYEITEELRKEFKNINEGKITLQELSAGPPTGAPVEARISGDDLDVLDQISVAVVNILKETEGVINVNSNREVSPADLTFSLDKEALAKSGLTVGEVSSFLRTAIFGVTATEASIDGEDIDIVVRLDKDSISSVEEIQNISLINNYGQEVKLSYVADFSLEPALASVRHRDFVRTITVQADLEPGFTPSVVVPKIEKKVKEKNIIPSSYTVDFGGEVEDIEQSFNELWSAMIVAVLLIMIILVLQFNSYKKPFSVLMTLPLMLIGVVIGMLIFNLPFSFAVFLGLVSLAGIVVNDAIVLLDKTQRNVDEKGMLIKDALADAGDTRLQPIMLTSITTIIGVIPLAIADPFWLGMSIAIIFGLAFATIMQLFIIPMVYLKFEGKKQLKQLNK